ncbi:hypothetical protein FOCC_FOCC016290 [Frankliniella occidentalis]|nr:hypothetical protein FOCC_FOCC016290 [Frankliniella occidentalis]
MYMIDITNPRVIKSHSSPSRGPCIPTLWGSSISMSASKSTGSERRINAFQHSFKGEYHCSPSNSAGAGHASCSIEKSVSKSTGYAERRIKQLCISSFLQKRISPAYLQIAQVLATLPAPFDMPPESLKIQQKFSWESVTVEMCGVCYKHFPFEPTLNFSSPGDAVSGGKPQL